MKPTLHRKAIITVTTVAALAGAGGAVAATQSSAPASRQAYIDDAAKHLGVAPSTLTAALRAAAIDRVKAEEAAGRVTAAQAAKLEQRIDQGDGLVSFGQRAGGGLKAGLTAAAGYLGLSRSALREDLRSGKSLATIAASTPGKSTAGLKAAILAAEKTRLDKAVASGRISSQQEQRRLSRLQSEIDALLTRTWAR